MATLWRFVVAYALPVPIVLVLLMALPLPRTFRKGVLIFIQRVFDFPIAGKFKLLHVMLVLMAIAFGSSVRALSVVHANYNSAPFPTPSGELSYLSKRWRAERNLWIAGFAFTMWATLAAFYREAAHRISAEDRLAAIETSDFLAGGDTSMEVSKEVSSRLLSPQPTPRSVTGSPSKEIKKPGVGKGAVNVSAAQQAQQEGKKGEGIELTPAGVTAATVATAVPQAVKKEL